MSKEVIVVLISSGISAITSLLVNYLVNKYRYNDLYARTVTNNRMEWINIWRKSVAELIACGKIINSRLKFANYTISNDYNILFKEFYTKKEDVLLRLNLEEEKHRIVYAILEDLEPSELTKEKIKELEDIVRITLKDEWERLKEEAKGKKKYER